MGGQRHTAGIKEKIHIKAAANKWLSDNLNGERVFLSLGAPRQDTVARHWIIELVAKTFGHRVIGALHIDRQGNVVKEASVRAIANAIAQLTGPERHVCVKAGRPSPGAHGLFYGDGIAAARQFADSSIDLLLTDPPYSISNAYTCQQQIPRRLRKNGADFIMPKGDFGDWDKDFHPGTWTQAVLPKVRGWAVIFCAQAQIAEYSGILDAHGFNAVGTIVWHKTNPVPFNHTFKPLNAWEAGVIGKRPGTKFHGRAVHNVFTYKSPSPQQRIHPTQKPLGLMKELTRLFSSRGDTVLDPFAGSGTTAYAAMQLGRKVMAYENNHAYYLAASKRLSTVQLAIQ